MQYSPLNSLAKQLIQDAVLPAAKVEEVLTLAATHKISFIKQLIQLKWVSSAFLATAIARDFVLPLLDLAAFDTTYLSVSTIDAQLMRKYKVLPLKHQGLQLLLAVADPTQQSAWAEIKFATGLSIELVVVEADKLTALIEQVLTVQETATLGNFNDGVLDSIAITTNEEKMMSAEDVSTEDAPIVHYVQKILLTAINKDASDIHFEPYEKYYRVRIRRDGVLYELAQPPINLAHRIAVRIKILAQLDISERRLPQDGRFNISNKNRKIDFRVSTCPTMYGEKIVLRILDPDTTALTIAALGLAEPQQELFLNAIKKSHGMILVTGPTGSGKTVTLYSALNQLNTTDVNISTVEDPVEIYLSGINQVNINPKAGLDFSTIVRAFLRQDPDVIMVGEIRDLETAEIAIRAAQTGHIVLSTLHTNSAPETLTRLKNMGVASFNIAGAVSLIIAQRLVRSLCVHCKVRAQLSSIALLRAGFLPDELAELEIYAAVGCMQCAQGYKGRVAIFEVLPVTERIAAMILQDGNALELAAQARTEGMRTLREMALAKVKQGVTSLAEIDHMVKA